MSYKELDRPRFPVYVRLGDFARSADRAGGIGAFLPGYCRGQECHARGLADLIERKLAGGECLVLLDGLDEVASANDRRAVVDAVARLVAAGARQGNRFVVTSRISGYLAAPLPASFDAIRLRDMDDQTIRRFLSVYCPAVERAEAPEKSAEAVRRDAESAVSALTEALDQSPGVRRLAANPLLLTALLLVHRARGRLPHRRIDAYVEVPEALGRTWRSVQGVPEADLPDDRMLTTWLTRLGAWLHENRPEGSATKREILEVLGPLCARLNGTEWELVELATGSDDPVVRVRAAGVLVEAGAVDPPVVAALVELATGSDSPGVRVRAAGVLGRADAADPSVVAALVQVATHSGDRVVRQSAVRILRLAEPTPALQADLISFFSDSNSGVRRTAGETLVSMARNHPHTATHIQVSLADACTNPQFAPSDQPEGGSGRDYAYEALWAVTEALAANQYAQTR